MIHILTPENFNFVIFVKAFFLYFRCMSDFHTHKKKSIWVRVVLLATTFTDGTAISWPVS